MSAIKENLEKINGFIAKTARSCGRKPEDVLLIAVTKKKNTETIREAIQSGAVNFGENYIQEARAKFEALIHLPVRWHFIGHMQSNKAKYAVRLFELIHTVDSLGLGEELDRQARKAGKVQEILIQVNISRETTKSGVSAAQAVALTRGLAQLPNIKVKGLMTMPPYFDDPDRARPFFAALRGMRDDIRALAIPNVDMQELSMGMTGDFEAAIEEGATLVRVGTAIFGGRP